MSKNITNAILALGFKLTSYDSGESWFKKGSVEILLTEEGGKFYFRIQGPLFGKQCISEDSGNKIISYIKTLQGKI